MEYGCIGEHLGHSFSKEIHRELADYEYEIREVAREDLDAFMKAHDFRAINVTIPYKEDVIPYLAHISDVAASIGAVNTIVNRDGKLYGYNTDFFGMSSLIKRAGISLSGKKVLILGTGGTSKTATAVASSLGASETIRVSRAAKDGAVTYNDAYDKHSDAGVIINTTPCGMYPNADAAPVDLKRFSDLTGVIDAIYNPLRTKLYEQAVLLGIPAACGLFMLVAQAARACGIFLDKDIADSETERVFSKLMWEKENIVFVGMPGVGKTTVGQAVAVSLGRRFVDTDDEITRVSGRTPEEIIRTDGEAEFRKIESRVIADVIAPLTSAVIATGGGTVLAKENVSRLKQNGRIVLLERPLDEIASTSSRPLSSTRELLEARYRERMPVYAAVADVRANASGSVEDVSAALLNQLKRMYDI